MLLVLTSICCIYLADGVRGQGVQSAGTCLGKTDCGDSVSLQCGADQHVFITKMLYGTKPSGGACSKTGTCDVCCQPTKNDCLIVLDDDILELAYNDCWNKRGCTIDAPQQTFYCNSTGNWDKSNFLFAEYICLEAGLITEFYNSTTVTAPAVAVYYDDRKTSSYHVAKGGNQMWHCQVDTVDCVQRQADVILVKEKYETSNTPRCSSVGWSGGPSLPCSRNFQYKRVTATTPFSVSVTVDKKNTSPSGWAVFRAPDASILKVTCGHTFASPTIKPNCAATSSTSVTRPSVGTPSPSPPPLTSPPETTHTINVQTSPALRNGTSENTSSSTEGVAHGTSPGENQNSDKTQGPGLAAVVGGAVAGGLVLVVAVVALVCCVRRSKGKRDGTSECADKGMTSMTLDSVGTASPSRSPESGSGSAELRGQGQSVTSVPVYSAVKKNNNGNKQFAVANDDIGDPSSAGGLLHSSKETTTESGTQGGPQSLLAEPDYDLLGQKKSQSSKPAALYGRLGEVGAGGEDTYSYDHLARGRQAAPDVINSDYDSTSAPVVTSEGDYSVADFHNRKQYVITGNVYDVARGTTPTMPTSDEVTSDSPAHVAEGGNIYAVVKPRPKVTSPDTKAATNGNPVEESEYMRAWECSSK